MKTNKKKQTIHAALLAACALTAVAFPVRAEFIQDENNYFEINGESIEITTNKTVSAPDENNPDASKIYRDEEENLHRLDEFENITVHFNPVEGGDLRALGVYSARYGMEDNNVTVYVGSEDAPATIANNDGLHLSNHFPDFYVRSYTAYIYAPNSDALNLSHDITTDSEVYIGNRAEGMGVDGNGDLYAEVLNGNGIRANATVRSGSKGETFTNAITVGGKTNITLDGGAVTDTVTLDKEDLKGIFGDKSVTLNLFGKEYTVKSVDEIKSVSATASYNPAAVYAGNDMYNFNCEWKPLIENSGVLDNPVLDLIPGLKDAAMGMIDSMGDFHMGQETKGQGKVILDGGTELTLNGKGNLGLFAGKNGHIEVNDYLKIDSSGENSYGIAAKNANLIYGDSLQVNVAGDDLLSLLGEINADINLNLDESQNTHGTSVTLGENTDVNITMNGENSYALYAEGVDDTAKRNQNSITSEGEGIDTLYAFGDVMAENSGLIDLKVTAEQNYLEGDIKAYGTTENVDVGATVTLDVRNALAGQGTIAAANGGTVNLSLGAYSNWTGRADDYQDAAADSQWGDSHADTIDNAFGDDKEISSSGTVNLSLGEGAMGDVTGQSWVTELNGNNSLVILDGDGTGGHALHVGKLTGTNTFTMNVRPDETGDMLYVKDGSQAGTQNLIINNRDEVLEAMDVGDKIRFVTVQNAGGGFADADIDDTSSLPFGTGTRIAGAGVFNVDFGIEYHDYGTEVEGDLGTDETYNGSAFDENKPGDSYVDDNYGPAAGGTEKQALFAENGGEETPSGSKNVYIVRKDNTMDNLSNGGKTVIAMSKVNYSNAVYMDRLNKRMGEARFLEGDDGLWGRLRHDRIGKSDAFRSKNTMFEIGYDWKDDAQKDGTHYRGVAFDYMRGTADYTNVLGEGDVRRAGLWYHDTWMGGKGHYTDYVVKYGRLSNDFDIYGRTTGEKISGDYDNDVWSVSAEYGRKKDLGNDWYIEPQAQLQYAYVTDASYTTSQGTKVSLDSIDSLIGRAGFRLGRDTDEANTVYFKADILHEFLGGQSIRAMDSTGTLSTTYENEGTWYDVGFGFSHRMSEDKYMFLDVEKLFGNDNEDTYQINIGLNMAF